MNGPAGKIANNVRTRMAQSGGLLVAFSGGVDSAVVARLAFDALRDRAVAVTARSATMPSSELAGAKKLARQIGIRHMIVDFDELSSPGFRKNPANRCYLCRKSMAREFRKLANRLGLKEIADGATVSDLGEHRPGIRAATEEGIWHPLMDAKISKPDVRAIARYLGLPVHSKPSSACLSSRIPYGEEITNEKLRRIERSEEYLRKLGLNQVRVRSHGNIARIEVEKKRIGAVVRHSDEIIRKLRSLGFVYVSVDLDGYRSGSLDEVLRK